MDFVKELVDVNEFRLAIESACDNLNAEGIVLSPALFAELTRSCRLLGIDEKYWRDMKVAG
jgi:hypothetical protein